MLAHVRQLILNAPSAKEREQGFAIVFSLILVSFVVLLLLSLVTFVQIETRIADQTLQNAKARQNALWALNIALGELQKHTGPDQRVTAKADVVIPEEVEIEPGMTGEEARDLLSSYWNSGRNRNWTGVWKNTNTAEFNPNNPTEANAIPTLQKWLVSGNESEIEFEPTETLGGLTVASTPLDRISASDGYNHRILANPAKGNDTPLERVVTAPEIPIQLGDEGVSGHYAWWVGDEGIKARINLVDDYALTDPNSLRRIASAQRVAMEAMTVSGSDGLGAFSDANDSLLKQIFSRSQLSFINDSEGYRDELQQRLHDITVHSLGVLADVKNGGLKSDLSYILSRPDAESMHMAVNAAYGYEVINSSDRFHRVLDEKVSLVAKMPSSLPSTKKDPYANPGMMEYTPTWDMLWSYHNMGNLITDTPEGVFNTSGEAVPVRLTSKNQGLNPISVQAKVYYDLEMRGSTIWVRVYPLVVLANPYSVKLGPADYTFRFLNPKPQVRFGNPEDHELEDPQVESAEDPKLDENGEVIKPGVPASFKDVAHQMPYGGLGETQLILRSEGMEPGEAQIFTLETSGTEIPLTAAAQRGIELVMINDLDPSAHIVYNTNLSIPDEYTHAALFANSSMETKLYMDYDASDAAARDDSRLIHRVLGHKPSNITYSGFVVFPMNSGIKRGAGLAWTLYDMHYFQRNLFYQQNYRTNVVDGFHGYTSSTHLLQWARVHAKMGQSGNEDYYQSHLMRPVGNLTNVRWGPINSGDPNSVRDTLPPASVAGTDLGFVNLLYDIPIASNPLSSLGQLQHFNTNAYIEDSSWNSNSSGNAGPVAVQSWQSNYPISNSYAHFLVARDQVFDAGYSGYHYDGSYMWNEILWDKFYFSSYPGNGDVDLSTEQLVNDRYRPFRSESEVPLDEESAFRGTAGDPSNPANSRMAATNLMAEGTFNINSTSVDAWKAVFAGLRGVPIGSETNANNLIGPFARTPYRTGGSDGAERVGTPNSWNGFRNLSQDEINKLAEEMVLQVQLRGPFTSMADFVNRRLISDTEDIFGIGLKGALQAAIDAVTNTEAEVDSEFELQGSFNSNLYKGRDYMLPTIFSGSPGYLLQGDVLSSIGQHMSARSDTFVIRTYGDATNPINDEVQARAWCEAVVQRVPDYVAAVDAPYEDATDPSNENLGRRYRVVSFRWLNPEEL